MNKELIQEIAIAIEHAGINITRGDVSTEHDDVEFSIMPDKKDPTKLMINEWHSQWFRDRRDRDESKSIYHSFDDALALTFDQAYEWADDGKSLEDLECHYKQIILAVNTQYQEAKERWTLHCARCGNEMASNQESLCDYCCYVAEKER